MQDFSTSIFAPMLLMQLCYNNKLYTIANKLQMQLCCVSPRVGAGGRGMRVARARGDAPIFAAHISRFIKQNLIHL